MTTFFYANADSTYKREPPALLLLLLLLLAYGKRNALNIARAPPWS